MLRTFPTSLPKHSTPFPPSSYYADIICTEFRSVSLIHLNRMLVPNELITQKYFGVALSLWEDVWSWHIRWKKKGVIHLGLVAWEAEKYTGRGGIVSVGNYVNFYQNLSFIYTSRSWAGQTLDTVYGEVWLVWRQPLFRPCSFFHSAPIPLLISAETFVFFREAL